MCLHFLDLLQHEHFRRELTSTQCAKFIDDQIILHWHHYARKRTKLFQNIQNKPTNQNQTPNQTGTTAQNNNSQSNNSTPLNSLPNNSSSMINGHANLK